ncbi:MAG: hypothetical protein QME94_04015 [Anaerolineae bacterium]|nr:hypothetical protein [Anaerolineae bacterium]
MTTCIDVRLVKTRSDLSTFVRFPWQIYRGDRNWVPPLISEREAYLTPGRNPSLRGADLALFLAQRRGRTLGTVAAFAGQRLGEQPADEVASFGFFETVDDLAVARALLDAARAWARERGKRTLRGPYNLTDMECPGVLIEGADCPPVMLAAHTPPYYATLLEQYGMEKYDDLYAWRAFRRQIGDGLERVPEEIMRAAQVARGHGASVRKVRLERWHEEIATAHELFNATLNHLPGFVPVSLAEFRRLADPMRQILDPDLALIAEVEGRAVGFCVSVPDVNRALMHLNGRLFPFGWLKLWWYARRIDVLTFKLMGVLSEYRLRGIDALLFVESLRAMMAKHYQWLDGSLTSERNPVVNLMAGRFGAERYKHYRVYEMAV